VKHCRDQVSRTIDAYSMISPGERVLVAVSGGKDSLALWDLLLDLGIAADGLYLGLGIGASEHAAGGRPATESGDDTGSGYSAESGRYAKAFAERRGARLVEIDLPRDFGYDIPTGAAAARRVPCSACGLSKRHLFNRAALEGGYDVIATGHNLDDEAAVLFGNVLRWDLAYLGRQHPVLPASAGFARKVKPLIRLAERETAAYCVLQGIDYIVEECPMAAGNRHLGYKAALNEIESASPGSKAAFYFGFLDRVSPLVAEVAAQEKEGLHPCPGCGSPTVSDLCAFCKLVDRAGGRRQPPVRGGEEREPPVRGGEQREPPVGAGDQREPPVRGGEQR
jgi:uncharacterized protein (TIGR00269 family)